MIRQSLIDRKEVLMHPLYINLGLLKQFIKDLDKKLDFFRYLNEVFHIYQKIK